MDVASHSARERVEAYIENVEQALRQIEARSWDKRVSHLVRLVRDYVSDSRYYLERGDVFTALAAIAYAEGLLDSLRWLGLADFEWKPLSSLLGRPRVVVAGTFDIIHPGHIALLREANQYGRVYVVVARDENVQRFKGRKPIVPEDQRLEVVSAIRYVHEAMLGSHSDVLEPIVKLKPSYILLGPDQWAREEWLQRQLEERGLSTRILRLEERRSCPLCSTTEIACRVLEVFPPSLCKRV